MAFDKVVDSAELDAGLKVIANAIRKRAGTTAELDWYQPMADAIENIPASGVQLPTIAEDVLGTASDLAKGKQLIGADGSVVTGEHVCSDEEGTIETGQISDLHYWEKFMPASATETEKESQRISSYNPASIDMWDNVDYADSYEIVGGTIALVDPRSMTVSHDSDNTVLLGKYIYASYTGRFYYIPVTASIKDESPTYGTSKYVTVSPAILLEYSGSDTPAGFVVSADRSALPDNEEVDGYRYLYQGTLSETQKAAVIQALTITENGTYTPPDGVDGYAPVTVNVPSEEIPTVEQATPSITVSTSGLITASATQEAGQVAAGTKSATKQLTTQAAQEITPGTSDKTIASGKYLTGTQTIKGDSNLKAENIKKGVSIFGVAGSHECEEGFELPAIAEDVLGTAEDLVQGKQLIGADGSVVKGTMPRAHDMYIDIKEEDIWEDNGSLYAYWFYEGGKVLMESPHTEVISVIPLSALGNAQSGDVRAGKTFTSKEGLKIPGAWEPPVEKDVNFWDYDGTLLYSYTLDELQELTELPPNANHEGLVGEGWNWTLEGLKENNGPLDVAALYVTEDEATWFDLENNFNRNVEVTFLWNQNEENGARIDFGDGSEPYITGATGDLSVKHVYQPGKYRAKIHGTYTLKGTSTSCCVNDILAYGSSLLKRVYIGKTSTIGAQAFKGCVLLESYSLPNYCYLNGIQIFLECRSLKFCYTGRRKDSAHSVSSGAFGDTTCARVVSFGDNTNVPYSIPPQIKRAVFAATLSQNNMVFANNHVLKDVKFSDLTTILVARAFQNCYSLLEITVPASVTTINAYAFAEVKKLRYLRFKGTTPPTVANANAFYLPTDCIVEVPAESLTAYQEATNYGTIAAQMVGV